jgi:hypothetical protein
MSLNLVYHYQASQNQDQEFVPSSYGVVYFFGPDGFLDQEFLREMSKSVPSADHTQLTFLNLDELKAFALRVAIEFQVNEVRLISVQDYNIGLDGARDKKTFGELFQKYGEVLVNEASRKKGLLGKFFS